MPLTENPFTQTTNLELFLFAAGTILASFLLTGLVRYFALHFNVIDHPNHRSMHETPIPRGGGVGFVLLITSFYAVLAWKGILPTQLCIALSVPPLLVAFIGLIDDFGHVSRRIRLGIQIGSATMGVMAIGSLPAINLPSMLWQPSLAFLPIAIIALVWLTNLYNFMDGINGLAGLEAISVLLGAASLCLVNDAQLWAAILAVLAATLTGFLPWNFPRARIFMGDCGSGFLGLSLGLLAIATSVQGVLSIWSWTILLGVFITDSSWTLIRRITTKQAWNEPHRQHAYQLISHVTKTHTKVSLGVVLINTLWLLPLAAAAQNSSKGIYWVILAYLPLLIICLKVKAGSLKTSAKSP